MSAYRPEWKSIEEDGLPEAEGGQYFIASPCGVDLVRLTLWRDGSRTRATWMATGNTVIIRVTHYARFEVEGPEAAR